MLILPVQQLALGNEEWRSSDEWSTGDDGEVLDTMEEGWKAGESGGETAQLECKYDDTDTQVEGQPAVKQHPDE
jgi:hypothetical protein